MALAAYGGLVPITGAVVAAAITAQAVLHVVIGMVAPEVLMAVAEAEELGSLIQWAAVALPELSVSSGALVVPVVPHRSHQLT